METNKLFETKEKLENKFPSWEVTHTGGGIFLIRKNFKSKDENDIMVSIGEENVVIVKHKDHKNCKPFCFASMKEYKKNEEYYWENAYEHEMVLIDESLKIDERAKKIFSLETLNEIICSFAEFANIMKVTKNENADYDS